MQRYVGTMIVVVAVAFVVDFVVSIGSVLRAVVVGHIARRGIELCTHRRQSSRPVAPWTGIVAVAADGSIVVGTECWR